MVEIFVNLKRFDVPRSMGGICPMNDPKAWIEWVIDESIKMGLGTLEDINVTFLLPEGLILIAKHRLESYPKKNTETINIGSQGIFRKNIVPGGNFGAFTTNLPAAAVKNFGCKWTILGHSEERKDKLEIMNKIVSSFKIIDHLRSDEVNKVLNSVINSVINDEVLCALNAGINVLLCVGETAEEKGEGMFEEQKNRIKSILKSQLELGLKSVKGKYPDRSIVIGYEPVWAIGPGKIPPGREYISFVSSYIKSVVKELFDFDPVVVYGGGLKEENAGMISKIETIGGGLVALTKFIGDIAFEPIGLRRIIDKYFE